MWLIAVVSCLVVLTTVFAGVIVCGASRWSGGTQELHTKLMQERCSISPDFYDAREIDTLPAPVRRYFQAVLNDGQRIVSTARFAHEGQFNMGETRAKWRPFTSTQLVITRRPGFDWDAHIAFAPGLKVFVHDAYVAGMGSLQARLFGLLTLADQRATPEMAHGELMRFLAEAPWYPTALLPSQGVRWEAIDDNSATASLTDGMTTVALVFQFDDTALIRCVRSGARHRMVKGVPVATPWQGRFWSYVTRDGMRVPLEGEVAWELPAGLWPYWRGRMNEISFEYVQGP